MSSRVWDSTFPEVTSRPSRVMWSGWPLETMPRSPFYMSAAQVQKHSNSDEMVISYYRCYDNDFTSDNF